MIANISSRGQSFKGVTAYLMHDKEAPTSERVMWTQTHNLHTDSIDKASRFMAWTDLSREQIKQQHEQYTADLEGREARENLAGRPATAGNVYHYSLSWSPDEKPDQKHMQQVAQDSVKHLGLEDHQYYLVAHDDTDHTHVHVVVNLADPVTGQIANVYKDRNALDRFSHEYELEHGIKCDDRDQKFKAWDQEKDAFPEKKNGKEHYGELVTSLYRSSDTAQAFQAALEDSDLSLTTGKRRAFVLVDRDGDVFSLNKLIEPERDLSTRVYGKQVTAFLSDGIDKTALPSADELSQQKKAALAVERDDEGKTDRQHNFEEVAEPQEAKPEEKDSNDERSNRTTEEHAQDYLDMARNPLHDLRGWLDETQQRREEGRGLFAGSQRSGSMDSPLLPLSGKGRGENAEDLRTAGEIKADEKWTAFEAQKSARIDERKEYWSISRLENELKQSEQHLEDHFGWFYRWIYRSKLEDARDDVEAKEKNLDHARDRWRQDIEAIHASRPQWAVDKELEVRGFGDSAVNAGDGQERTTMEAAQAKEDFENQALNEAQGSDEAAARLDGVVTAKTGMQKEKVARVHSRAETFKAKQAAKKQAIEQDDRDKEKERIHRVDEKRVVRGKQLQDQEREDIAKKQEHDRDQGHDQLARDMATQRQELDADERDYSKEYEQEELSRDERQQLRDDMEQQRQDIEQDDDGLER